MSRRSGRLTLSRGRYVCDVRERALDRPPVVAQRHEGVRDAAHLALQAVGGLLRRLERVAAGGVRS
jgi:hypothetical protein